MEVDLIFRIAAIGILVAVLNQVLIRAGRDEQAMMTTLAGLVVVLMMVSERPQIFPGRKTGRPFGSPVLRLCPGSGRKGIQVYREPERTLEIPLCPQLWICHTGI